MQVSSCLNYEFEKWGTIDKKNTIQSEKERQSYLQKRYQLNRVLTKTDFCSSFQNASLKKLSLRELINVVSDRKEEFEKWKGVLSPLLALILSEYLHKKTSSTLRNIIAPYSTFEKYFEHHLLQASSNEEFADLVNSTYPFKPVVAFSVNEEELTCRVAFNMMWHRLGFTSKHDTSLPLRPFGYHAVEVWNSRFLKLHIQFGLDVCKRKIKLLRKNQALVERNECMEQVRDTEVQKYVKLVLSLWAQKNTWSSEDAGRNVHHLTGLVQLCIGSRHHEVRNISSYIPMTVHQLERDPFFEEAVNPESKSVDFFAVFRFGKGDFMNNAYLEKVTAVQTEIKKMLSDHAPALQNGSYRTSEPYNKALSSILGKIHALHPDTDPKSNAFHKRVQLIAWKPLMYTDVATFLDVWTYLTTCASVSPCALNRLLRQGYVTLNGKRHDHALCVTTHKLRHLYANGSHQMHGNRQKCSVNRWIQHVLGHNVTNLTTSLSYQTFRVESEKAPCPKCKDYETKSNMWRDRYMTLKREVEEKDVTTVHGVRKGVLRVPKADWDQTFKHVRDIEDLLRLYAYCKKEGFYVSRQLLTGTCKLQHQHAGDLLVQLSRILLEDHASSNVQTCQETLRKAYVYVTPSTVKRVLNENKENLI